MYYETVFENEHFIVVDKRPNVLSVPSRMGEKEERPILGLILQKDLGITLYPVHRLDFEVQGLIMFAKTPPAQRSGNSWFENKIVEKSYSALTKKNNEFKIGDKDEWKCKLLRGKKRAYESSHGKESITFAHLLSETDLGYFHWELRPVTGRSHQLRYELFRHHMPIVGDSLYGSTDECEGGGIFLRSFKIDFKKVMNRDDFFLPEVITSKTF